MTELSTEEKQRVRVIVDRAVALVCTVGRTLEVGSTVTFEVADVRP